MGGYNCKVFQGVKHFILFPILRSVSDLGCLLNNSHSLTQTDHQSCMLQKPDLEQCIVQTYDKQTGRSPGPDPVSCVNRKGSFLEQ